MGDLTLCMNYMFKEAKFWGLIVGLRSNPKICEEL